MGITAVAAKPRSLNAIGHGDNGGRGKAAFVERGPAVGTTFRGLYRAAIDDRGFTPHST
jgi:hypothetical protein